MRKLFQHCLFLMLLLACNTLFSQNRIELNTGWYCRNISEVKTDGAALSDAGFELKEWLPATVPGTVLTTLLNNKLVPDPFIGMNNQRIPDIYATGNAHYTYWFVKDFETDAAAGEQVWLQFRGVNYKCEVWLNGKKLNSKTHEGMLLRQQYNITSVLRSGKKNRLAVLVYPPDNVGNPNGGQGGDGTIARDLTTPYTAGWDWIQPVRDRNTGIWDKVTIEKTGAVNISDLHVITTVPGKRKVDGKQAPALINMSCRITNAGNASVKGILQYQLDGNSIQQSVSVRAGESVEVSMPAFQLNNPKLWWPAGYGPQHLYKTSVQFIQSDKKVSDKEELQIGVRQIETVWNGHTQSMQTNVNGQKIFIKGGNWIISDAMLRFSPERYDAEVRFHRDMNLNLIRIWGGALTERPEFYEACDKYGMLVFQDFWFSGDCNGRWLDPMKKDDQWTRRKYPDNHNLTIETMADQIKLIRNYPSLAFWCGGNEIAPPDDILHALRDSLLPMLDGTRRFFDYSNSDSMSYNSLGGNGDGPYTIQDESVFWNYRTFPFNSEIGSVGVGDYASLLRFIPVENLVPPPINGKADSVWEYHKYIPYHHHVNAYGAVKDAKDFAMKAQLVNYTQYRSLIEGHTAHMWDWYTGTIIWKTQNPWTSLRGQMYDYYLDVNACLYGLRTGSKPLHIMMNPTDSMIMLANHGFERATNLMLEAHVVDVKSGKDTMYSQAFSEVGPATVQKIFPLNGFLSSLGKNAGSFVLLRIRNAQRKLIDENFYWLPGADKQFTALQQMPSARLQVSAKETAKGIVQVTLSNDAKQPVAFFNRVALIDTKTGKRILPAFFSDNYVSVMPGESKVIEVEYPATDLSPKEVQVYGWNVAETSVKIR
ncbi:glycosyl hydrolase [Pseudoflavitalea sp. G-6-1-2]|uniref:glycoside hydrolase family 2 protein n=1 Tax=Pseudoflavitalea sp. G-6-1-2 TaxID=2728841 RepID=UPI00146B6676|nr:glycosyl hydrolase [Pseudoflavitalea sp. G-6-1-2]NML21971.1 glycosyl hydrolase [Pseudoflavitalea sp. G-6-1-2]